MVRLPGESKWAQKKIRMLVIYKALIKKLKNDSDHRLKNGFFLDEEWIKSQLHEYIQEKLRK